MICKKCRFKSFCYAANQDREKCDPLAERWTIQYYYFVGVISLLEFDKKNANEQELLKIECEIEDLEYSCEAACEYMSEGPHAKMSEPIFKLTENYNKYPLD